MKNHMTHLAFSCLHRTPATRNTVRKALRAYLRYLRNDPAATDSALAAFSPAYLKKPVSTIFSDVCSYITYLRDIIQNSPNTIRLKTHYVLEWLDCNHIIFHPADKKILQNLRPRAVTITEEAELTRTLLRRLIENADPVMTPVLLILASSGMRISELLNIRTDQIIRETPTEIHIPREHMKAGKPHVYHISHEAEQALDTYLSQSGKSDRIFPFCYTTIRENFAELQKQAGTYQWCNQGKRSKITLHSIRKWTESTMKLHIPINLANELIGHDEGLSPHYRRYGRDQLRQAYLTAEPHLTLLTAETVDTADITETDIHQLLNTLITEQKNLIQRLDQIEHLLKHSITSQKHQKKS